MRVMPFEDICLIVEIDGHESHKTKEQRYADYKRERFFLHRGYHVMRFTGSEVFVDPLKCVMEADDYIEELELWYWRLLNSGIEMNK